MYIFKITLKKLMHRIYLKRTNLGYHTSLTFNQTLLKIAKTVPIKQQQKESKNSARSQLSNFMSE